MEKIIVNGGRTLNGELVVPTAKNSLLPILASTILVDGVVKIKGYECFSDCESMLEILRRLGAKVRLRGKTLYIDSSHINASCVESDVALKLRASIYTMGAIMYRMKIAKISYPGGCFIGARPIDQHLKGLRALGGRIIERHGYLYCKGENLTNGEVHLDIPSVGATYNIIMASVCLKGTTVIYNPAKEPEIVDLQGFLNACGAKISGAGTDRIVIKGVGKLLHSCEYKPIGDRIIAGTYLIAVACCTGKVKLKNINPTHLESLLYRLEEAGCEVYRDKQSIILVANRRMDALSKIDTQPYPGFPTDLQAPIMVLQAISNGHCVLTENLFESRYKHITELTKMGADIMVANKSAIIKGVDLLYGADVYASDLRAGASLIIAGLVASGYTTIHNIEHIDRGYIRIEEAFQRLGADIIRKNFD